MAVDPAQLQAQQAQPLPLTPVEAPRPIAPITTTVSATSGSPVANAAAIGDVAGGLGTDLNKDAASNFAPYRQFALTGLTILGVYALVAFGFLLGVWILSGNTRAAGALGGLNIYFTPILVGLGAYVVGLFTKTPGSRGK